MRLAARSEDGPIADDDQTQMRFNLVVDHDCNLFAHPAPPLRHPLDPSPLTNLPTGRRHRAQRPDSSSWSSQRRTCAVSAARDLQASPPARDSISISASARRAASRNSTATTESTGSPNSGSPDIGSSTMTRRNTFATSGDAVSTASCTLSFSNSATNACRCTGRQRAPRARRSATSSGRCTASLSASSPGPGRSAADAAGPVAAARRPARSVPVVLGVLRWAAARRCARIASGAPTGSGRRVGAQVLEALAQLGRVEPAAVGQLHDVLVPHQVVGVLGHRRQCRLGRPGASLGRREVAGARACGRRGTGGRAAPP